MKQKKQTTNFTKSEIFIRVAVSNDAAELCVLVNQIIGMGGTTAMESQLTADGFRAYFLEGENHLCCFVAVDESGALAGFQALERHPDLPDDWADIATFARAKPKIAGVGAALFSKSKLYAEQIGVCAINATIRADNNSGLIYYERMGFQTYSVNKNIPLDDGTPVDRISKRFLFTELPLRS